MRIENILRLYKQRKECGFGKEVNCIKPVRIRLGLVHNAASFTFFYLSPS